VYLRVEGSNELLVGAERTMHPAGLNVGHAFGELGIDDAALLEALLFSVSSGELLTEAIPDKAPSGGKSPA
jgi:hypothetical protein